MERDTGSIEKTPSAPQKGASLLLVNHTKEIADSQLRTTIMSIDSQP